MVTINVYEGGERGGGWGRGQRGRQRGGRGAGRGNPRGPPHHPRGGRGRGRPRGQGARQRLQQQQNQNVQQGQAGQQQQQQHMIQHPVGMGSQNVGMGHHHGMPHPQMQHTHPQQMMNAQNQQPWMRQQQQQMLMRQQQGPPQQSLGNNGAQTQGPPQFLAYSQGNQVGANQMGGQNPNMSQMAGNMNPTRPNQMGSGNQTALQTQLQSQMSPMGQLGNESLQQQQRFGEWPIPRVSTGQRTFRGRRPYRGRAFVPNPNYVVHPVLTEKEREERTALQAKKEELELQHTQRVLEEAFGKLKAVTDGQCQSLLKKHLSREVFEKIKERRTSLGASLLDVIQSGVENLDSAVGVYAADAECYKVFAELFDPIIDEYHGGFPQSAKHPKKDFGSMEAFVNIDPSGDYVISTWVSCERSLENFPFNPCLTDVQYMEMEKKVCRTFKRLSGELQGTYYPLLWMTKEVQAQLVEDHFLFKEGDRFLQAASACRYWPVGRGIFHNDSKTFLVWVNEEDHLRIISMQQGGNLATVYQRMVAGVTEIESDLPFARSDRLGYLTFCPTKLGTTIRASVHIRLPFLAADKEKLYATAAKFNLQVRGTSGEHSDSVGGVYDISNKRRLGLTEFQAVKEMQDGILELIKIEKGMLHNPAI